MYGCYPRRCTYNCCGKSRQVLISRFDGSGSQHENKLWVRLSRNKRGAGGGREVQSCFTYLDGWTIGHISSRWGGFVSIRVTSHGGGGMIWVRGTHSFSVTDPQTHHRNASKAKRSNGIEKLSSFHQLLEGAKREQKKEEKLIGLVLMSCWGWKKTIKQAQQCNTMECAGSSAPPTENNSHF